MAISIESLLAAPSEATIVRRILATLSGLKFPVTAWGEKSVPRALIKAFAAVLVDTWGVIGLIAAMGLISRAQGPWLTLAAKEWYGIDRLLAVATEGQVGLVVASTASGDTIAAGDLTIRANTGATFTNVTGGTLVPGATLLLSWRADEAGEAGNVTGASLEGLVTPIPGVTISAASGTAWITTQGTDDELDEALRLRCYEQWSTLGAGGSAEAIDYHCRKATSQVTRTRIYEATPVPGRCRIVLAGPAGGVSSAVVTTVRDYLEDARRIQCVAYDVESALNRSVPIEGVVKVRSASMDAAKAYVATELLALQQSTDLGSIVDVANLIRLIRSAPGCTHLALTAPAADVVLTATDAAIFAEALTWQAA